MNWKAIVLIFFNVSINCYQNNLQVVDANQRRMDYCRERRGDKTFYFIATQSTYVSMYAIGSVHYSYVVLFVNKPANPIGPVTNSPQTLPAQQSTPLIRICIEYYKCSILMFCFNSSDYSSANNKTNSNHCPSHCPSHCCYYSRICSK